jgi:hypothetical protein
MLSTSSGLAKLASSQQSISEGLVLHHRSSRPPGRYNAGGLDIVGPLPTAQGNFKFAVVAIDYVTKWIEARPLTTITSTTIRKFFWQQIICRFGVPRELTIDNLEAIRLPRFQGVLSFNRNKALLRVRVPPSVQQRSIKSQWANLLGHKEMPFRAEERKVGG